MIKSATVSARIDENIKSEAEGILQQLGIPVSVVINTLYHQIIIQKAVPFPMTLSSRPSTLESMSNLKFPGICCHYTSSPLLMIGMEYLGMSLSPERSRYKGHLISNLS